MFVSLFIALVLFRLIAAGAGESFSALDLNPGGSSAAFSFSIFRACVCLALEGLWHSGWGCAGMCMQESACDASADDSSARGRSAQCAGSPIACCAGPVRWSLLGLEPLQLVWAFCLVCMMQLFPLCCCLWGGWCLWVCVAPKWGGVLGPGPKVGS